MKQDLLTDSNQQLLATYARSSVLLAFDFDGTLAPIVADPQNAHMRARTRELLLELAHRYPCAVISGRGLADVSARLEGLPLAAVIGNHGLEPDFATQGYAQLVRDHLPLLARRLDHLQGVILEDKRYSISIHYREADPGLTVLPTLETVADELRAVFRAIPGKRVLNLVPNGAPNKGTLLERLRRETGSEKALYAGDDVTDEDVFELDLPDTLLSVRIERSETTRAQYYLQAQTDIDQLLERLIELRPTQDCERQTA